VKAVAGRRPVRRHALRAYYCHSPSREPEPPEPSEASERSLEASDRCNFIKSRTCYHLHLQPLSSPTTTQFCGLPNTPHNSARPLLQFTALNACASRRTPCDRGHSDLVSLLIPAVFIPHSITAWVFEFLGHHCFWASQHFFSNCVRHFSL
jgi:hypothetical protein